MRVRYGKPEAVIVKCSGQERWVIDTKGNQHPYGEFGRDWESCPGTLFQDYGSVKEAQTVALWWGYRIVEDKPKNAVWDIFKIVGVLLFCIGCGMMIYAFLGS